MSKIIDKIVEQFFSGKKGGIPRACALYKENIFGEEDGYREDFAEAGTVIPNEVFDLNKDSVDWLEEQLTAERFEALTKGAEPTAGERQAYRAIIIGQVEDGTADADVIPGYYIYELRHSDRRKVFALETVTGYSFSGVENKFHGLFASVGDARNDLARWGLVVGGGAGSTANTETAKPEKKDSEPTGASSKPARKVEFANVSSQHLGSVAFIPHRLALREAPQYSRFPLNVMFGVTKVVDGKETRWTAVYAPDFSTFEESEDGSAARMFYRNPLNRDWNLVIAWRDAGGNEQYTARKYSPRSDEPVFETDGGGDWDRFFTQLTMTGLTAGEACKISPIPADISPQSNQNSGANSSGVTPAQTPPVNTTASPTSTKEDSLIDHVTKDHLGKGFQFLGVASSKHHDPQWLEDHEQNYRRPPRGHPSATAAAKEAGPTNESSTTTKKTHPLIDNVTKDHPGLAFQFLGVGSKPKPPQK